MSLALLISAGLVSVALAAPKDVEKACHEIKDIKLALNSIDFKSKADAMAYFEKQTVKCIDFCDTHRNDKSCDMFGYDNKITKEDALIFLGKITRIGLTITYKNKI